MQTPKKNPLVADVPAPMMYPINLRMDAPTFVISSKTVVIQGARGPIMREGFTTDTGLAPNRTVFSR